MRKVSYIIPMLWMFMMILTGIGLSQEAPFIISKSSDFSTDDRVFERTDMLYILVDRPNIDYTDIDEMEYCLKPKPDGQEIEGHFTNHFDGTYTAEISLEETEPSTSVWELKMEIKDNADNEFKARVPLTIGEASPPGTGEEIEINGRITAIEGNQIQIRDIWITVDESTEITDKEDQLLTLADLFIGLEVEVEAVRQDDGSLLATMIKVDLEDAIDGEVEAEGVIVDLTSNSLVVDGLTFFIDENTEVLNSEDELISFEVLSVGTFVEVKGQLQEDGSILAERIKVEQDEEKEDEVEICGPIDAITETSITVTGIEFLIDSETEIIDDDDLAISLQGLQVGAIVEVKGEYRSDGLLWAIKIKLEETAEDEFEEEGEIEAIGELSITVNGILFQVDEATVILDDDKQSTDFSVLQIGMEVEVKAIRQPDGTNLALRIKIEKEKRERIKLTGRIEALTESSITVLQTMFLVDETTKIEDQYHNPIHFSDLQLDMMVKIEGYMNLDGNLIAEEIEVKEQAGDEIEITGMIVDLREGEIDVGGLTFTVTANTIILNESKDQISFGDLQLGLLVEVRARRLPDMSYLALKIQLEDQSDDHIELKGYITNIVDNTVVVEGVVLLTTSETQYVDQDDNPLTLADFSAGDFVEVEAEPDIEGNLIILQMKLEEIAVLQGVVQIPGGGNIAKTNVSKNTAVTLQFLLVSTLVSVDENTLVIGSYNILLDAPYIQPGAVVYVQGTLTSSGELMASSVKVLTESATNIDPSNVSPVLVKLILLQNYPNPFNPETTIEYTLPEHSHVTLTIYNLLGQRIAALINKNQEAGHHTVRWNANNQPSGMYFYKLEAGNFVQMRKMILLR